MSIPSDIPPLTSPQPDRSAGRKFLWSGIGIFLSGFVVAALQYAVVGSLIVPWYSAIMGTIGAALLLWSIVRRRTVVRFVAFALIALLAGAQWHFLMSLSKLPAYAGLAHVGEKFPAFETKRTDGTPYTNQDLEAGETSVLVFFRGRW